MSFEALLADLGTMQKSLETDAADDKKIALAAAESDATLPAGEGEEEGEGKKPEDEDGRPMLKSLTVTLADGTVQEAFDGAEMVKALTAELDALKTVVVAQADVIKLFQADRLSTREMVKSLSASVAAFGNTGSGRKATIVLGEKRPAGAPALPAAAPSMTVGDLMAKAMSAVSTGKIDGDEAAYFEARVFKGEPMKDRLFNEITAKILA